MTQPDHRDADRAGLEVAAAHYRAEQHRLEHTLACLSEAERAAPGYVTRLERDRDLWRQLADETDRHLAGHDAADPAAEALF